MHWDNIFASQSVCTFDQQYTLRGATIYGRHYMLLDGASLLAHTPCPVPTLPSSKGD